MAGTGSNASYLASSRCIPEIEDLAKPGAKAEKEIIGIFAHVMRQIMVDAARKARSRKRGGGLLVTPFENNDGSGESLAAPQTIAPEDVLAVDHALTELEKQSSRRAEVFERKYFLGMTVPEIASALDVSVVTIERDWREGKKFLSKKLGGGALSETLIC